MMISPREPARIADAAAEQVRALNLATLDADAYGDPAGVRETALSLRDLARWLPQAVHQLQAGLDTLELSGDVALVDDSGDTVIERQAGIAGAVRAAQSAIANLEGAMDAVARLTSGLSPRQREQAGES